MRTRWRCPEAPGRRIRALPVACVYDPIMSDSNPEARDVVIAARVTSTEADVLDTLAARWKLDRSGTLRRLVLSAASDEAVAAVEVATWPKELPHAMRY